ncbi:MAG: CvpA family protein [Syntrophomonadaceae bacterium]|jgi:uncharacterized membrane protein required for colicin V production|nr:CvpA family protein [Syntrophomonadaceae bacterium]
MQTLVLDCILVVLVLYGFLVGFRRGLIASIGSIASLVLGIGAAILYWEPVTDYLQNNYSLITYVAQFLAEQLPMPVFDNPQGMVSTLLSSGLYAYQGLIYHIARLIVAALVFILLLFLVSRLLALVWHLLSMVFGWGILGAGNRMGGAAFEALKIVLLLSILAGLALPLIRSLADTGFPLAVDMINYLDESLIIPYLEGIFEFMGRIIGVQSEPLA